MIELLGYLYVIRQFCKGEEILWLSYFLNDVVLQNTRCPLKERIFLQGANSILQELTSVQTGGRTENDRVGNLESIPIHRKGY